MQKITLQTFFEIDPKKKDAAWGNSVVSHLRMHMKPLVDKKRYDKNMTYLFSEYNMEDIRKMFKDPDKAGISFKPESIMEKIKNVLSAEHENAGINVRLQAIDPSSINQKERDRQLLASRKEIEALLNGLGSQIGAAPFSLADEKDGSGKSIFGGDVKKFDSMGLDDTDPQDLNYYFATWYKLRHELRAEDPVNYFIKLNEVAEDISLYVNDILAVKAIAHKAYVNDVTGGIDLKYLAPHLIDVLPGVRRDFNDASAKQYRQVVSVQDFVKLVGNDFDWEKDIRLLLRAVNTHNNWNFTNIHDGSGYNLFQDSQGGTCSYTEFMQFKVAIGYIEWKSNDASAYKITDKNTFGNTNMFPIELDKTVTPDSIYVKKSWYTENTYKCYYLDLGSYTQKLYKFGKLSFQEITGDNDEYSGFSIICYREKGRSAVEVAIPHINRIEKATKKYEYLLMKAKADGRAYHYDSLLRIAQSMYKDESDVSVSVLAVINQFLDSEFELYTSPVTESGDPVGGGGQSSYKIENGLSKMTLDLWTVIEKERAQLNDELGITNLRDGSSPDKRDGYKINAAALQSSHNATQYMRSMMMNMYNNIAKKVLAFVQDIILFKDKDSVAYKHLLQALGDDVMDDLESLGEIPLHRYGIFVESLNTQAQRDAFLLKLDQAFANKEISLEQYLLVSDIPNVRRAIEILAYEKKRLERELKKQKQQDQQFQMQMAQQQQQTMQNMRKMELDSEERQKKITGEYLYLSRQGTDQAGIEKQQIKGDQQQQHTQQKTIADQNQRIEEANAEAQKPLSS